MDCCTDYTVDQPTTPKPADDDDHNAFAMAMLAISNAYVVACHHGVFVSAFHSSSSGRCRRHATSYMGNPLLDGWGVVAGAQAMAARYVLPESQQLSNSVLTRDMRLSLAACLTISMKFARSGGLENLHGTSAEVLVLYLFLGREEQLVCYRNSATVTAQLLKDITHHESLLVFRPNAFALLGEHVLAKAELLLWQLLETGGFDKLEEMMLTRAVICFFMRSAAFSAYGLLQLEPDATYALVLLATTTMHREVSVDESVLDLAIRIAKTTQITPGWVKYRGVFGESSSPIHQYIRTDVVENLITELELIKKASSSQPDS